MAHAWPEAWHRFLLSPSVSDNDRVLYLKLAVEHARYLAKFPSTGNWLTMEMSGLYTVGALFPELKEAAGWRKRAAETLRDELKAQFGPDGAQIELTPGYHQVALDNILRIPMVARRAGFFDELPRDYASHMEAVFGFNLSLMTPDWNWPRFNDSWPVNVPRSLEDAPTLFPARADFAWAASRGKEGQPPTQTSRALDWAGYFVMRSGWQADANYLVLDAGPLGYGHVHQDKLNVVLWAFGREVLFDGGGGSYETSKWRTYATDTPSHNTVLVDNLPQRRQTRDRAKNVSAAPIDARWQSTPTFDFARGTYTDGYGKEDNKPASHTRRVLFAKPDLFVVSDTLVSLDGKEHEYQARWHLLPTEFAHDAATNAVETQDDKGPNLAVVPLETDGLQVRAVSAQQEPELLGWHIRKDMDPQYVPASTVVHTRRGTGTQMFLTLLVPIRTGQKNPIRSTTLTRNGAVAQIEVQWNDGRRTLIEAPDDAEQALKLK
jgi:hypothetical protein